MGPGAERGAGPRLLLSGSRGGWGSGEPDPLGGPCRPSPLPTGSRNVFLQWEQRTGKAGSPWEGRGRWCPEALEPGQLRQSSRHRALRGDRSFPFS